LQGDCVEKWYVKLLTVTSIKAVKCILSLLFDSPAYNKVYQVYLINQGLNVCMTFLMMNKLIN